MIPVRIDAIIHFADDFETNRGWVVSSTPNPGSVGPFSGNWVRVDPHGTTAAPEDDHTSSGTMCYVTGDGASGEPAGANDIDNQTVFLTSPTFSVSDYPNAVFSYCLWYSNVAGSSGDPNAMKIDLSNNNGSTWATVETIGAATQNRGG